MTVACYIGRARKNLVIFVDCHIGWTVHVTVNFLNIRTLKKFVAITLNFELCGSTIE